MDRLGLEFGRCSRWVLSQLGPLCDFKQSLIRNSRRTTAFQHGERVLSTHSRRWPTSALGQFLDIQSRLCR